MTRPFRFAWLLGFACLTALAAPAYADRVDGEWCDEGGRRIVIEGRVITTPAGAKVQGEYGRHVFSYDAPAGETPSGRVHFQQFGDDLMQATSGDAPTPRAWRRCRPVS
jgi:hypothetical protein